MINITPDPVAFTIGSFPVHWYGICYAIGLAAVYLVLVHEAKFRGEDPEIVGNALIIVAIAALIGGRAYHVIDQWQVYIADPIRASCRSSASRTARTRFRGSPALAYRAGSSSGRSRRGS
jgi:prolipoprotein diacylglyceryltransferase